MNGSPRACTRRFGFAQNAFSFRWKGVCSGVMDTAVFGRAEKLRQLKGRRGPVSWCATGWRRVGRTHRFGGAEDERDKALEKIKKPKGASGIDEAATRRGCNGLDIGAKP